MGRHSNIRTRHRVGVRSHRLSNTYVFGALMLIFTFAITMSGAHEAYQRHDTAWAVFFALAGVAVVGLYFELVARWIELVGLND